MVSALARIARLTPCQGKIQELLLREDKLSLDKAIQICRTYEQSNKHIKELRENNSASHAINRYTSTCRFHFL
jgi:hypothetical protein